MRCDARTREIDRSIDTTAVYGSDSALQMVKDMPVVLTASRRNFAPSLDALGAKFGVDESKAMVMRNPGLLFLKPTGAGGADTADNLTMRMSYVVAATRPIGARGGVYVLVLLLASPFVELATGIPISTSFRDFFFSSFSN